MSVFSKVLNLNNIID